ncbi:DUF3139 domain-containing protein [Paenibacillus hunanensis]|uniref:DUF3139 domain-containing protein n=1 Tax=Paenibacillus hunanensis TaxID=539262 RepID=A0ABU1IZW8_9BACL|nr:DUF3139 domain-containing protein [Paenibacillus hunanensis]MDR6244776.1 hypothetical protein [Paenibacillus hunanensis]GGJ21541.1 hypothetical protein GCM10008022_33160 [Paenibacillus hunanensis]
MKKKVLFIILGVIVLTSVTIYSYLQIKYTSLENGLRNYLITVEGYKPSDIVSVEAKLSSMPKYPVYVEFADDPGQKFIFTNRDIDLNTWYQLDPKTPQKLTKNKS